MNQIFLLICNPVFGGIVGLLGILVGLAGILIARRDHSLQPIYTQRDITLIEDKKVFEDSVQVLFQGKALPDLTVTRIAFWNNGREVINWNDVAQIDPIRVVLLGDSEILEAKMIFQKKLANNFIVSKSEDNKELLIKFDYIDKSEGAIFQIFHTGKNEGLVVRGTIKGCKTIKKSSNDSFIESIFYERDLTRKERNRNTAIACIVSPLVILIMPSSFRDSIAHDPTAFWIAYIITTLFCWLFAYFLLKRRVPKGFEDFLKTD
jgi:hypothetical protein